MITVEPILLDVELSVEEYGMNVGDETSYDMNVESPIVVNEVVGPVINGVPRGGLTGDLLAKKTDEDFSTEWITPATSVEQDNTRPITAAAVYTEIGNINALLATI